MAENIESAAEVKNEAPVGNKTDASSSSSKRDYKEEFKSKMFDIGMGMMKNLLTPPSPAQLAPVPTFTTQIQAPPESQTFSDERLKEVYGEDMPVECFRNIRGYTFEYTPQAQAIGAGDRNQHYGVMAQNLEENPLTRQAVNIDSATGFKTVDTNELTTINTAALGSMAREITELKAQVEKLSRLAGIKFV